MTAPHHHPPAPAPSPSGRFNGFGLASLLVGIAALAVCWLPFIGIVGVAIGVVGITLGIIGIALQQYRGRRALAIIGTSVSGLALILSLVLPWFTGVIWAFNVIDQNDGFTVPTRFTPEPWLPEEDGTTAPSIPATPTPSPSDPSTGIPEPTTGSTQPAPTESRDG